MKVDWFHFDVCKVHFLEHFLKHFSNQCNSFYKMDMIHIEAKRAPLLKRTLFYTSLTSVVSMWMGHAIMWHVKYDTFQMIKVVLQMPPFSRDSLSHFILGRTNTVFFNIYSQRNTLVLSLQHVKWTESLHFLRLFILQPTERTLNPCPSMPTCRDRSLHSLLFLAGKTFGMSCPVSGLEKWENFDRWCHFSVPC